VPSNVAPGTAGLVAHAFAPGRSSAAWLSGTSALAYTVPSPLMRASLVSAADSLHRDVHTTLGCLLQHPVLASGAAAPDGETVRAQM
jgi:hypothetical protein